MHGLIERRGSGKAIALIATDARTLEATLKRLGSSAQNWTINVGFRADPGSFCIIPNAKGEAQAVLVTVSASDDVYALAGLPGKLPPGTYFLDDAGLALDAQRSAIGWGLGAYHFSRYRKPAREPARLALAKTTLHSVQAVLEATYQVRDLVNTPTQDLGPAELTNAVADLAAAHSAVYKQWIGDKLLTANFPTIHAVGRASTSDRAPRLAMLTWGKPNHPKLTLIGKGVCFDTGGLDLKTSDGMRWMKKDMGGAAHAIALAGLVMTAKLPVRLTLLIPAVENSVSGDAMRPGEVIRTRAGHTVEIDNTDAEGRLILCDALAFAAESKPDLLMDFATLTGAARIALGPDLPALFCNRDDVADALLAAGRDAQDPLWRLPLFRPYRSMLDSYIADFANAGASRHAGSITAALYLERFVPDATPWCHVDVYSWNDSERPGRPRGGEAQALRATFAFLQQRYSV
jgi:leucyl aminopeptidase